MVGMEHPLLGIGYALARGTTLTALLLPRAPSKAATSSSLAITRKGFRPFFGLAGLFAIAIVPLWLLVLHGSLRITSHLDPVSWHAHEMVFGFVTAVIAGFLLTAVGNWTERETATGTLLLALAALWLAGRLAMGLGAVLPPAAVALADLAFLPALVVVLGRPLVARKNYRNFPILMIVSAIFLANLSVHLEALGVVGAGLARRAGLVGVDLVLLLISVIAGRVLPMFTRNATGVTSIRSVRSLDALALIALAALTLLDVVAPSSWVAAPLSGVAGVLAACRAVTWGARHSFRQPLVWILHAGYAWLAFGLMLRGMAGLGGVLSASLATHALTVGAIGSLTLGMMARVALGHTGRMLVAGSPITWAFVAINLAALARVFVPLLVPGWYFASLVLAGALWVAAFAVFLVVYTPILLLPRVDGKPG
jgi:uncharacterized protein involved in response to NO